MAFNKIIGVVAIAFCVSHAAAQNPKYELETSNHQIDQRIVRTQFNDLPSSEILSMVDAIDLAETLNGTPENQSWAAGEERATNISKHFELRQQINDIPVYRGFLKLNTNNGGKLNSIANGVIDLPISSASFPAEQVVNDYLVQLPVQTEEHTISKIYFPQDGQLIPAKELYLFDAEHSISERHILDEAGNVIYIENLLRYHHALPDTTVKMLVFDPDPLTTSSKTYSVPYTDANNANVAELNAQRVERQTVGQFANGNFSLENDFLEMKDISAPVNTPPVQAGSEFLFRRGNPNFEEANVFYHITAFQNYLQSLGLVVGQQKLDVDAHGFEADQSVFQPNSGGRNILKFGDGGVDDGEDADVIIHEYGHAVSYSAAPNTNSGNERLALDEALGDYYAVSYSRSVSSFNWDKVFNWDGHNEFWGGRYTFTTDIYPQDLVNNLYEDADIWSDAGMEVWALVGRNDADRFMTQSLFNWSSGMSMQAAAGHYITAANASTLSATQKQQVINIFCRRGLYRDVSVCTVPVGVDLVSISGEIEILNNRPLSGTDEVVLSVPTGSGNYTIRSLAGQLISSGEITQFETAVAAPQLSSGLNIIEVVSGGETRQFKVMRVR